MTESIISKRCSKCKNIKPISEYGKYTKSKDGLKPQCKECTSAYNKQYFKKYFEENKDYFNKYNEEHKEKTREYNKQYFQKNKERLSAEQKKYRDENKERLKRYHSHYQQKEDVKISIANTQHKRRFKKHKSSDGTIPVHSHPLNQELKDLLEKQGYRCNICRCGISDNKHLDHHIPLSKGGMHSISNVAWLCPKCNQTKGESIPGGPLTIKEQS